MTKGDLQREQGGGGDTAEGGAETPADNLAVWRAFARRPKGAKGESGACGGRVLPEVREFIRDATPITNTTRGGRRARHPK